MALELKAAADGLQLDNCDGLRQLMLSSDFLTVIKQLGQLEARANRD